VLRNLTPHAIDLLVGSRTVTVPADPAGPARVAFTPDTDLGSVDLGDGLSIPLVGTSLGSEVSGLPDAQVGVMLVVSRQVVEACPDRVDLVFVHRVRRGPDGQPVGAAALARPASSRAGEMTSL